jgi:hypothetical protein
MGRMTGSFGSDSVFSILPESGHGKRRSSLKRDKRTCVGSAGGGLQTLRGNPSEEIRVSRRTWLGFQRPWGLP